MLAGRPPFVRVLLHLGVLARQPGEVLFGAVGRQNGPAGACTVGLGSQQLGVRRLNYRSSCRGVIVAAPTVGAAFSLMSQKDGRRSVGKVGRGPCTATPAAPIGVCQACCSVRDRMYVALLSRLVVG